MAPTSSTPTLRHAVSPRRLGLIALPASAALAACGGGSTSTPAGSAPGGAASGPATTSGSSQGGQHHTCKPPDGWANNYSGIVMKVSVTMSNGITTITCTFDNPEVYAGEPGQTLNCASLPQFEERVVPNFHSSSHSGGTVDFNVTIPSAAYKGPGTYTKDGLNVEPFFFTEDTDGFGLSHYVAGTGTTATVTINADASGRFEFSGVAAEDQTLPQPDGKPWPPVSGSVAWTCRDQPSVIATPG